MTRPFAVALLALASLVTVLCASTAAAHRVHQAGDEFPLVAQMRSKRSPNAVPVNPPPPQPETCSTCTPIATQLVAFLANETDEKQLKKDLEYVCTTLNMSVGDKIVCDLLAGVLAEHSAEIVELISHGLGWSIPTMICALAGMCKEYCCVDAVIPEQRLLTFAHSDPLTNPDLNVRFVSLYANISYGVQWRQVGATEWNSAPVTSTTTIDDLSWVGAIHGARMSPLQHNTTYEYRVGRPNYWTDIVQFTTIPSNAGTAERPLRFVQIGDMGWMTNFSGNTEHALTRLAESNAIDFILHIGDISYANGNIGTWDIFCREIDPISSRIPYMTVPGNHEFFFNFTAYKRRFGDFMPRAGPNAPADAMYYALNFPPAMGVLMMNSESPFETAQMDATQIAWAGAQLTQLNAQRSQYPFVSAMHHRPLYCTGWKDVCNGGKEAILNVEYLQRLVEKLYYEQKVDVVMCGHVHDYERTWPVYKNNVQGTSYANASAPFYIVNGAGGNHEGLLHPKLSQPWEAAAIDQWGFLTVEVTPTLMSAKYIQSDTGLAVDEWSIPK